MRVSRRRDCSLEGACQGHAHFPDTEYLKRVTADRTVAGLEYLSHATLTTIIDSELIF